MGPQRVLQAVAVVALGVASGAARADAPTHERVAIIDLGPDDGGAARRQIAKAVLAAGLDGVAGDGVEDALAGGGAEKDAGLLADALDQAKRAFGELDCAKTTAAAKTAVLLGAQRQAAGLAAPELAKAWGLVLACADRAGDADAAMYAARMARASGGGADPIAAKYPAVDVVGGGEELEVDVVASVTGATVWIDHAAVGTSPVHVRLAGGKHVVAAAGVKSTKRGALELDVGRDTKSIAVPLASQKGAWAAVAKRIAGWGGKVPVPGELAQVLSAVHARVAIYRYGQTIEAWGQAGKAEPPHRLGGQDGVGSLATADDAARVAGAIADRVHAWNDHAPDPDVPLMTEARELDGERRTDHAKWWVYAVGFGALALVGGAVYWHDNVHDTQHLELRYAP